MNGLVVVAAVLVAATTSACGADIATPAPESAARGHELYEAYCASCHGAGLEGAPNWRTPNEDGSYPPPPHDSSGHTWHHSDRALMGIIRDGSDFPQSRMPAFGDRLTDAEIEAILDFLKTTWGPEERAYQRQVTDQDEARR